MCFFSLSLSAPEFHANHRRISLQAPRSHQLPSATFCHTLSEGRCLKTLFLPKVFPTWLSEAGKYLASLDPDVHTHVCGFSPSSLHRCLPPSLWYLSLTSFFLSSSLLCNFTGPVSHIIHFFLFAQSFCFFLLQVKQRLVIAAPRLMFIPDLFILSSVSPAIFQLA